MYPLRGSPFNTLSFTLTTLKDYVKTYTKAEKFATPEHRELLKKHFGLIELVNNNQYLPPGYDATVQELNRIHKEIYGVEVDLTCNHCVYTLFVDLYIPREVMFETEKV